MDGRREERINGGFLTRIHLSVRLLTQSGRADVQEDGQTDRWMALRKDAVTLFLDSTFGSFRVDLS